MTRSLEQMTTRPRIVVVGSSNTDLVIQCENLPKPGETVLGKEFQQFVGGKGANQAVAAALAGARVTFIGACGSDDFGKEAKLGLRRHGVDVRHFKTVPGVASGVALILVGGQDRQNVIAVARSANDTLGGGDVKVAAAAFRNASAVLCQLEIPMEAVEAAADLARINKVPFILNPAPARTLSKKLMKQIHTLTPNENEAAALVGATSLKLSSLKKAARELCEMGCRNVVVTLGSDGALLVNQHMEVLVPAHVVKPVDTVGAGDAFTAYFAVGIAEGLGLKAAVERAVIAAAICVTRPGAQSSMPLRSEVLEMGSMVPA